MPPKIIDVKHLGGRKNVTGEENVTGTSVAGAIAMVAMARWWRIGSQGVAPSAKRSRSQVGCSTAERWTAIGSSGWLATQSE